MNGFDEIGSFGLVLGDTYSFLQQGSDQFRRAKVIETLRGIVVFEFEDGTRLKIFHQDQGHVSTCPDWGRGDEK